MKARASWLIALAFIAGLFAGGWTVFGRQQQSARRQWEYTHGSPTSWNALGEQGWELVNCASGECYFKRPK